ncbi:hypothetical protein OAT18_00205 [Tenacibaculum sp.]|nr:hypothetical protein [Tenacibaculum sp.]
MQSKKITLILAVLATILSIVTFVLSQNSSEQVYVDVNKLLDGYKRTKIVRGEFQKTAKTLKLNVDSLVTDWQKELKLYEKERSKFSKKELMYQGKKENSLKEQHIVQKVLQNLMSRLRLNNLKKVNHKIVLPRNFEAK